MSTSSSGPGNGDSSFGQLSLRDILTTVFKRRNLVILVAVSFPALVMTVSLLLPRVYEVTAILVVNRARAEMPMAPTESAQAVVNQLTEQDLNSEIEILMSREMLEGVLREITADGDAQMSRGRLGNLSTSIGQIFGVQRLSNFDHLVIGLQEDIEVQIVRRSNAIRIAYRSEDPQWATKVVGTLTDHYLERRTERFQSPQAALFFEEQMLEAERRLKDGEAALKAFADETSIIMIDGPEGVDSLSTHTELVMERLATLEGVLGDANVAYQSQQQQVASLREQLLAEPERLDSSNRMNQGAATEEIERALAALELERDALLQEFKPGSRHVRDIDTQIALAETRLAEARSNVNVDGTEPNPVYLQLKGDLLRADTELNGILARIAPLETQVAEYRRELDQLNESAFGLDGLRRTVRAAEEDYLLYRKKHEEARASSAMDQEKFINLTVAQPARMPLRPVSRELVKRLAVAMMIGVFGGLAIAVVLEQFIFRSFTTGADIERTLGIPHVASIPETQKAG